MTRSVERQGQQWPHRRAALQHRGPVQPELPFDEKAEPLWRPPHGLPPDFDPFDDLGEHPRHRHAAPIDWSRARSGPLIDIPPREQDPGDAFATRPYSGPLCPICNNPPQWVSGPSHRHASIRRVRIAMPMPTNLQLSSEQPDYTGSHGMQVMQDHQGDWSFKQPKPSLAFTVPLEAAFSTLQRQMGLEAPESYAITHQGRPAVVSKWYPNSTQAFQKPPRLDSLSPDDQMTIQKNHVLDWLVGNHDAHVGNWMRTQDGKLVSIDKGQAAKYFGHDRLDPHFHPNYYAREPIYNQLYRDHAKGRGQLHDPRTGELGAFVNQVQSLPDEHLKAMFRPYAQSAAASGLLANPDGDPSRKLGPRTLPANDPEAFLDALVARKNNLHNDLGDYHDRMSARGQQLVGYRAANAVKFRDFCNCGAPWNRKHQRSELGLSGKPNRDHFQLDPGSDAYEQVFEQHYGGWTGWSTPESPVQCRCGEEWSADHILDPERNTLKSHNPLDPETGRVRTQPARNR